VRMLGQIMRVCKEQMETLLETQEGLNIIKQALFVTSKPHKDTPPFEHGEDGNWISVGDSPRADVQFWQLSIRILNRADDFVNHKYGNYLIQTLVEMGRNHILDHIQITTPEAQDSRITNYVFASVHAYMQGKYAHLAQQKYSSNVIEKMLGVSSRIIRSQIILELIEYPDMFFRVLNDQFGNYVVQNAIFAASRQEFEMLRKMILPITAKVPHAVGGKWRRLLRMADKKLRNSHGS